MGHHAPPRKLRILLLTAGALLILLCTGQQLDFLGSVTTPEQLTAYAGVSGEYYSGDGRGFNCYLTLQPWGRFQIEMKGCLGTYHTESGSYSFNGTTITLRKWLGTFSRYGASAKGCLLPLRWGGRLYLVPESGMIDFCNRVNRGWEPRHMPYGREYIRKNDWDRPVLGPPTIPDAWRPYLLRTPLRVTVKRLLDKREAVIDRGSAAGILPDLVFTSKPKARLGSYKVVRVRHSEADICPEYSFLDQGPVVGMELSTKWDD